MLAKVFGVFEVEKPLRGSCHLPCGGQQGIWKDVARDPRIWAGAPPITGDRLAEEDATILQTPESGFHVTPVVPGANMFKHADADDTIEGFVKLTVVLEADFDRQAPAGFGCVAALLLGNCDSHNAAPVVFGRMSGESAPPAANIQKAHSLPQPEFSADEIHLFALRLGEIVRLAEPRAGILHRRIEHAFEKVVAHIVVTFADDLGPTAVLDIEKKRR